MSLPARVCARGADDRVAQALCASPPAAISSLEDLYGALQLASPDKRRLAATTHSLSLSGRTVSGANPRVVVLADNSVPGGLPYEGVVATAFARGEQQVELVALDPATYEYNFYLLRFVQRCNASRCTSEPLLTMDEQLRTAGDVAAAIDIPLVVDGGAGFGEPLHAMRTVRECIRAGIAGTHIEDQLYPKRAHYHKYVAHAVSRREFADKIRFACKQRDRSDPDFVVMAQCYARDAANGGLDEALRRLRAYKEDAGVDWVQLESPHSVEEIKQARAAVSGPFSFMKGKLPRYLGLDEHLALGVNIAWYPSFTHHVTWAALFDFMQQFNTKGIAAWEDFVAARKDRPYPVPEVPAGGEGLEKQRELEERYLSQAALAKYRAGGAPD